MLRYSLMAVLTAAFFATFVASASAAQQAHSCSDGSLHAVASRTHTKLTPCVAKPHELVLETTYYQNASRTGGTALAAYPEARVRYGVAPHAELFVDTPSEIAKSGEDGRGIYIMTQTGVGAKVELARVHNVVYSVSAESHPPLGALASLDLVPLSDVHVSANWAAGHRREFALEAGTVNYSTVFHQHLRATSVVAGNFTQALNARTAVTLELMSQSHVLSGSRSEHTGVVALQQNLSHRILFNVELGTAFNVCNNTKPHYLGAGFTIH
jgi:hypothetical protein